MSNRHTVLIIDDEEVVRDSCTHILKKGNYRIETAEDGEKGLKMVEDLKPDIVFVDLKMPGISGMEVLERLSKIDSTIVSVVITGYATIDSAVEAIKRGAYDFLPKPFSADELRLIAQRAIEKRMLLLDAIALRQEKEMIRENLTSIISHELKSPLLAVQQNLFALSQGVMGEPNPAQKEALQRIENRVDALLKMINTWVDLTSLDFRQLRERFRPLDMPALISKVVDMLRVQAVSRDIEVVTHCPFPVAPVEGDEGTLLEVFMNIIGNAIKYSENGSRVSVKIEERDQELHILVSDRGIGIEKEDIPFIFDDFYRGRAQSRSSQVGSGLGLTISRRIMKAHDGSIAVESEPGKGSTFTVVLPKRTDKKGTDREPRVSKQSVM